ncbi:hypothetical protein ASPWEDRAFT_25723 [Aspergillus wentii DTO 134E9]|uniref:Ketoreductase domain-containing protein n=1 Tax=Aspergillus wentii DTO 134E9 TaxID=1073089 RepID=A0A1L9RYE6_ASPWE|nr:uncharacterized protein ASPWEDRAFT_25723 [Aspergillus wentii DTO 134E9]KAI9931400.1 hypothetical protein MW887_009975 [Aspergillus wentii]OJJ39932.1 hypothetical protein ASPWEDRAFT_25723 [Aspergillus wentii DTO 134E9]
MFELSGIALVTGAASGIGRECALAFAAEGAAGVVFADLNLAAAEEAAEHSKTVAKHEAYRALAVSVDVTDRSQVDQMVEQTIATFGRVDYSVNAAGIVMRKPTSFLDVSPESFDRVHDINTKGVLNCVQAVGKIMQTQEPLIVNGRNGPRQAGRGSIVNLGSIHSFMAGGFITEYNVSKHAVLGLTKSAAIDLAPFGVRVNVICPSWVDTPMINGGCETTLNLRDMAAKAVPLSRVAQPEEVADVILFMCSANASYVTGSSWTVDGGLNSLARAY